MVEILKIFGVGLDFKCWTQEQPYSNSEIQQCVCLLKRSHSALETLHADCKSIGWLRWGNWVFRESSLSCGIGLLLVAGAKVSNNPVLGAEPQVVNPLPPVVPRQARDFRASL